MRVKGSSELSWIAALSWIVGSTLVFSIGAHKTIRYVFSSKTPFKEAKVEYVVQTGLYKEALHSDCLMEILELSSDHPKLFSSFNEAFAEKRLRNFPVIANAFIKKIPPNMLYIDYSLRKPLVWLGDFSNAALDSEGVLFPISPFFSPKKLPEVFLGSAGLEETEKPSFGSSLNGKYLNLAFLLLEFLQKKGEDLFFVKKIDVSHAFIENLGKREVVLVLENEIYMAGQPLPVISTHYLRISPKGYEAEIENYLTLRNHLLEVESQEIAILGSKIIKEKTIDLRLSQMAFIR